MRADSVEKLRCDLEATVSAGAYSSMSRRIKNLEFPELRKTRIGWLASVTLELLESKLVVEGARKGFHLENYFAPFAQFEQELLIEESELWRFEPDLIVLVLSLDEISVLRRWLKLSEDERRQCTDEVVGRLERLIDMVRNRSDVPVLIWNFAQEPIRCAGLADRQLPHSQAAFLTELNTAISTRFSSVNGAHIFDLEGLVSELGSRAFFDARLKLLARMPFSADAQMAISKRLVRYLSAIMMPPKKCLVLDLDNTLWGGIVGEDGLSGIRLGSDYPGSAYVKFHEYLLSLMDRGFLLAIASKNNYDDAVEVFEKHPDCVLKLSDFAEVQINWNDKSGNLREIAKQLNIGTDSLVFFDDSAIERELVQSQMPEVTVLDFPRSPDGFPLSVEDSGVFDKTGITQEDGARSEYYQVEKQRKGFRENFSDINDFLRGLETKIEIETLTRESPNFSRAVQLIERTNQFNLTTRRHGEAEIQGLLNDGAIGITIRVSDRFGDHGVVGLALARPEDANQWTIDTFLMSCRVIGRKIEYGMLHSILSKVEQTGTAHTVAGEYIPSKKNSLVKNFYTDAGFRPMNDASGDVFEFVIGTDSVEIPEFLDLQFTK